MSDRRMLRFDVMVNDKPQTRTLLGDAAIVKVAAGRLGVGPNAQHLVEFWAEGSFNGSPGVPRTFQVFGTGHSLPEGAVWRGTCDRTAEGLVWHLYELVGESA